MQLYINGVRVVGYVLHLMDICVSYLSAFLCEPHSYDAFIANYRVSTLLVLLYIGSVLEYSTGYSTVY